MLGGSTTQPQTNQVKLSNAVKNVVKKTDYDKLVKKINIHTIDTNNLVKKLIMMKTKQ